VGGFRIIGISWVMYCLYGDSGVSVGSSSGLHLYSSKLEQESLIVEASEEIESFRFNGMKFLERNGAIVSDCLESSKSFTFGSQLSLRSGTAGNL
jgi:hypothetical protein